MVQGSDVRVRLTLFPESSSALVTAICSTHGSSLVVRSGSPLGLSAPPPVVFLFYFILFFWFLLHRYWLIRIHFHQISRLLFRIWRVLARSASSLVGDDSNSSIFSSTIPVSELPALSLVSFAPILSSPVFPDSSLGLSEFPTSQRGPSNLLSSTILDPIFDNAVINESPDCVPPVSALLPPSAGDVSAEVSPSINADSSPWGPPGFRPSWGLPSMVDVLERLAYWDRG